MAKVLVTLEDKLLKRIDRAAKERGMTRSAYLAKLAEEEEGRQIGPGADPAVHKAIRDLRELFADVDLGMDSTEFIRRERDARARRFDPK